MSSASSTPASGMSSNPWLTPRWCSGTRITSSSPGELGQPQDREPELDAYGLPVQCKPAKSRTILGAIAWLIAIACLILGAVGAELGITYFVSHHKLAGHLVGLGNAVGILAGVLGFFFVGPILWAKAGGNNPLRAIVSLSIVGGTLGMIGSVMLMGLPNCPC